MSNINPQLREQLNDEQLATVQQLGLAHVPPAHLTAFFTQAELMQLNPLLKAEITLIERKSKNGPTYTIQVGIAGYRKAARRVAKKERETISVDPWLYAGADGVWRDTWNYQRDGYPEAARVTVYRDGMAFTQTAMWVEYAAFYPSGDLMGLWPTKPSYMLGKVAESLAWRQAFPEFADTYGEGELDRGTIIDGQVLMHGERQTLQRVEPEAPQVRQAPAQAQLPVGTVQELSEEGVALLEDAANATDLDAVRGLFRASASLPAHEVDFVRSKLAELANTMQEN